MSIRTTCYLSVLVVALAACTFDDGANQARGCDDSCAPGACYLGYCLQTMDEVAAGPRGGETGGVPALTGTSGSGTGGSAATGSTSGSGTDTSGSGGATASSGGNGGVTAPPTCAMPMVETCNGLDDDCDGTTDEDAAVSCYEAGITGCALDADGAYACTGLCASGVQACVNGGPGACAGAVQPTDEKCGGTEAADEDCDGVVDDDCPCSGTATQRCYSGRAFSAGIGICMAGTQRCVNGVFGACEDEVTPTTESCANQGHDDDCDFLLDDVLGVGANCYDWAQLGVCSVGQRVCSSSGALVCVTPDPESRERACDRQDEDCDGSVDEDFDLSDDPNNCGACGARCGTGQLCCGGGCHDPKSDAQNCGACGRKCGGDAACCNSACVPTNTVTHCGGCSPCAGGEACCGGGCVATDTTDHCGGCGACDADEACCGGDCVGTSGDGGLVCP